MNKIEEELVLILRDLGHKRKLPKTLGEGICKVILDHVGDLKYLHKVVSHFGCHPNFSGMYQFPVPHKSKKPGYAYFSTDYLWQESTSKTPEDNLYARTRLEFCLWLADEIEAGKIAYWT